MSYFLWNNIDSRSKGVVVSSLPSIIRPEKNIEEVKIDGRDGHLTVTDGSYKGTTKIVKAHFEGNNYDDLLNWLNDTGEVTFSNMPDRFYKAYIASSIDLNQIVRDKLHEFIISFKCQPYGYDINGRKVVNITSSNSVINNTGTIECRPVITIHGSGDIAFTIENQTTTLKGVVDKITINSELEECYKDLDNQNNKMVGCFPMLRKGNNTISWVGNVTKVEIIPNFRFLI